MITTPAGGGVSIMIDAYVLALEPAVGKGYLGCLTHLRLAQAV